jgi:hypothetical protein
LWHFQCSPAEVSSVLHPVARRIALAADLASGRDADQRRELLRVHLARIGDEDRRFTALWGAYSVGEIRGEWIQAAIDVDHLLRLDVTRLRRDLPIQIHHLAVTLAAVRSGDTARMLDHATAMVAM